MIAKLRKGREDRYSNCILNFDVEMMAKKRL
jgi:hypothetical protein